MVRRLLFAGLALALALGAAILLHSRTRPAPQSLDEYYDRLYPRGWREVGTARELPVYDYPALLETAEAVLVVSPEEELRPSGYGYTKRRDYAGTDVEDKYVFWNIMTLRRVKVLQVVKGENAAAGDSVWVAEPCTLLDWERILICQPGCRPMVKGCAYLLFLDHDPAPSPGGAGPVMTVSRSNGWFDLTHLSLNDPEYLPVLTAALADKGLLAEGGSPGDLLPAPAAQDGPEDRVLSTPWTEEGYALRLRHALRDGRLSDAAAQAGA